MHLIAAQMERLLVTLLAAGCRAMAMRAQEQAPFETKGRTQIIKRQTA